MRSMFLIHSELLEELYGKDLIAFGTGKIGKLVIPYLAQDPRVRLVGVTNSRITDESEGEFLDTGLPLRSLSAWSKSQPDATILVTVIKESLLDEILQLCETHGFNKILIPARPLFEAIRYDHINMNAAQQTSAMLANSEGIDTGNPLLFLQCLANEVHDTHKASFAEFKACHKGEDVAVIGCGPSMNYYSPLHGVFHVGVNASFKRKDLPIDYYFLIHYIQEWCEELKNFNFIKFFGCRLGDTDDVFPQIVIEENNARMFFSGYRNPIQCDIEYYPLMGYESVIFRAIHFAMYTRPKRLFLVGCDCAYSGHFDGSQLSRFDEAYSIPIWLEGYKVFKQFAARHYPDTEIISVNPIGLKGMFRDVYTESYLEAHPEFDRSTVEILNSADYQE